MEDGGNLATGADNGITLADLLAKWLEKSPIPGLKIYHREDDIFAAQFGCSRHRCRKYLASIYEDSVMFWYDGTSSSGSFEVEFFATDPDFFKKLKRELTNIQSSHDCEYPS